MMMQMILLFHILINQHMHLEENILETVKK